MSFDIVFSTNSSPSNKLEKDLTEILTASGVLRDGASILNPEILIETEITESMVAKINYAYIEEFSRYYYVTDIKTGINNLWIVSMHVDVLMTYRENVLEQNGIVARQVNQFNMYLDDGWFMSYQNPRIQTKLFSAPTPFEAQSFVLVVAGS